ncbi:ATP-binding protein [Mesobaculum littorinae]|nr:ATP-binding protein [Mesobaculum littorinae]
MSILLRRLSQPVAAVTLVGFVSAALSCLIAAMVLFVGWGLGETRLVRVLPDLPAMVPETALSLISGAMGAAGLYLGLRPWVPRLAAAFIGAMVASFFIRPVLADGLRGNDAMSIATATQLLLIVTSLSLRSAVDAPRGRLRVALGCDTVGGLMSVTALMGYLLDADALYGVPGFSEMALHTTICLLLVQISLILRTPDIGWPGWIRREGSGSAAVRRLFPGLLAVVIVDCVLQDIAIDRGWLSIEFALVMSSMVLMVAVVATGLRLALTVNAVEARAVQLERLLRAEEEVEHGFEVQTLKAQNLQALGQIVAGVAHDFNNSLSVLRGNLELTQLDPDRSEDYLREAIDATERASALTRNLLAYGRKSQNEPTRELADEIISEISKLFRRVLPSNIELTVDLDHVPEQALMVEAAALETALMNLLINARNAMPKGGRIQVLAKPMQLDPEQALQFDPKRPLQPGDYLTVSVVDTGTGMDAETIARARDAFFTTNPVGKGTGLGLSSVDAFCADSGGGLRIDSTPGQGTTMTMAIPIEPGETGAEPLDKAAPDVPATAVPAQLTDREVQVIPDDAARPVPRRGTGRVWPARRVRMGGRPAPTSSDGAAEVLLIGAKPGIVEQLAERIAGQGHSVQEVPDATEALTLLREGLRPVICVLNPALKHQPDGIMLIEKLRRDHSAIRVSYIDMDARVPSPSLV